VCQTYLNHNEAFGNTLHTIPGFFQWGLSLILFSLTYPPRGRSRLAIPAVCAATIMLQPVAYRHSLWSSFTHQRNMQVFRQGMQPAALHSV